MSEIDLKVRNKIAQLFVDMAIGESKRVTRQDMVPLLKEVNDTSMIGHAMRFSSENGVVVRVQKYRLTEVERRVERKKKESDE